MTAAHTSQRRIDNDGLQLAIRETGEGFDQIILDDLTTWLATQT